MGTQVQQNTMPRPMEIGLKETGSIRPTHAAAAQELAEAQPGACDPAEPACPPAIWGKKVEKSNVDQ